MAQTAAVMLMPQESVLKKTWQMMSMRQIGHSAPVQ